MQQRLSEGVIAFFCAAINIYHACRKLPEPSPRREIMCTLVILRRPGHPWPVILAANRAELVAAPWAAPGRPWTDRPVVVAGLARSAGGPWLRLTATGAMPANLHPFG